MEMIDRYHVLRVEDHPTDVDLATLGASDDARELVVPGRYLEAQFTIYDMELLFLSQGALSDELLDICVLKDGDIIEHISLCDVQRPGSVTGIRAAESGQICFEMPKGQPWTLRFHLKRIWTWPFQACVSRHGNPRSHFTLKRGINA